MGWVFGIVASAPLLLTFFGSREREDYSHQAPPRLKESLRAIRNNRPLLFAAGIFLFTWTAIDVIQVMLLYFLKYQMGLERQADVITGTVFMAALAVLPFWVWIAGKTDKRTSYVYGMVFLSAVMIVLAFIDPSLGFLVVLTLAGLAGVGVSAVHVLTWAMIPDAVEVDELESGARHEGMFYALVTLINKITISIAMPLALLVLDWSGFSSNAPTQSARTLWSIRILTGPVPALFLLAGILFARFYPVSRDSHAATRARIAARRP
jgi:GPH family glycoside/pentoside/hexuronide:cation symporter